MWGEIAGAVISGGLGFLGGERANSASQGAANRQMEFQERMSSTAYRRAMKDMKLAGLNPMLAYKQGGASSPGGAMPDIVDSIGQGLQSAKQGALIGAEIANLKAATANTEAQEALNREAVNTQQVQQEQTRTNTALQLQQLSTEMHNTNRIASESHRSQYMAQQAMIGVATARAQAELTALEAQRSRRWGTSAFGNNAESVERVLDRLRNNLPSIPEGALNPLHPRNIPPSLRGRSNN